jgi:hypothetical protein
VSAKDTPHSTDYDNVHIFDELNFGKSENNVINDQGGADFWSRLGDFLNDTQLLHARFSEMRPMNQELDDFEDNE